MLDLKLLEALPRVPAPVLTVYLNTAPADLRNLRNPSCYLIWLKTQVKTLEEGMQKAELRTFRELLQRVEELVYLKRGASRFLSARIIGGRSYSAWTRKT